MKRLKHLPNTLCMVGCVLLFCAQASGQMVRTRKDLPVAKTTKPEEKPPPPEPAVRGLPSPEVRRMLTYSALHANPCSLITREELEAILKRSENDRVFVTMHGAYWDSKSLVTCGFSANYENRIFPDEPSDNGGRISIDFDDKYARRGVLVVDLQQDMRRFGRYSGRDMELQTIDGVGDEAVFGWDRSRMRHEERYKSTAGASPHQYYDNEDFLYVRRRDLVLRFQISRTVAGNTGGRNLIEIARKVLPRVP